MEFIIGVAMLILCGVLAWLAYDKNDATLAGLASLMCMLGSAITYGYSNLRVKEYAAENIPAIEVYRGNTVLKVTYIDSVAVDTLVIYRKSYEQN